MTGAAGWLLVCAALLAVPAPAAAELRLAAQVANGQPARPPAGVRVPWSAVGVTVLCVAVAVCAASYGPVVATAIALAGGGAIRLLHTALRRRELHRSQRALLAALRVLGAELAAGSREDAALDAAAGVAGRAAPALRAAATAIRHGDQDEAAAALAADPLSSPLAAAWRVRSRSGAALAELVGHVERDLSDHLAQSSAVAAVLAGPRSSAGLLAALPVVGMALATQVGAHPIGFLTGSPAGQLVLLAGTVLDAAGLLWTSALARSGELT